MAVNFAGPNLQRRASANGVQDADAGEVADNTQTQDNEAPPATEEPTGDATEQPAEDAAPQPDEQTIEISPGQAVRLVISAREEGSPANKEHPQDRMDKFWLNFFPEHEGGVTHILPDSIVDDSAPTAKKEAQNNSTKTLNSYENARATCIKIVERIIQECRSHNQKYTDPYFDLERDLKVTRERDCLYRLGYDDDPIDPQDVKRVTDVFDEPQFFQDGAGFDDIVQGALGDCWMLAALSAITANPDLLRRICVIQDQEVGVYGFVFHRDGDWHPCVIDDKLYLAAPDYDESGETVLEKFGVKQKEREKFYAETLQTGSKALYFASCRDENETWVPLIEKAFAKAHGDYSSIDGGQVGEALEDLTGGVTTEIYTTNILNKELFWQDLKRNGQDFLFSCATAIFSDWRDANDAKEASTRENRRKGIFAYHAYSILDTYEGHGQKLVKIRNPWGNSEWTGPWSDGSKEWTVEWLQRVGHKFGDDGVFWMTYKDMLRKYKYMDRTRLFGDQWHVAQEWCSVQVPFATRGYQETKFVIDVPTDTEAVIVLSQLDNRYFLGLKGQYSFTMSFRVQRSGDEDDYICRSARNYELRRSSNVEVNLKAGKYDVLFKVEGYRNGNDSVEEVIRKNIYRREKVMQTATLYDLAYRKGGVPKSEKDADPEQAKKAEEVSKTDDAATNGEAAQPDEKQEAEGKKDSGGSTDAADAPAADKDGDDNAPKEPVSSVPTPPAINENDPDRDPWNAFCVLGLRVYSFLPDLELKVVRPEENKEGAGEGGEKSGGATLDHDDIAKAALVEANSAAQKEE